jgi:hypothetical protein
MQSDLKEKVISLIVKQLQLWGRSDVVELDTDLLTLGIAIPLACLSSGSQRKRSWASTLVKGVLF